MLVLGLESGAVRLLDETCGKQLWHNEQYNSPSTTVRIRPRGVSVACSPHGRYIASVDRSSESWTIWNLDGTTEHIQPGNMRGLESVTFSPCNRLIAVISFHGTMKVYNTKTYTQLWELKTPNMLHSVSFSGDSKFVAAVSMCGTVHIRYAATGIGLKTIITEGVGEFCPTDNNLFATTNGDDLALWNIETAQTKWKIKHGRDDYLEIRNFARFSPDGKTIATVQQDKMPEYSDQESDSDAEEVHEEQTNYVLVVDAANGETKFSLAHLMGYSVYDAAFSPDGGQLACVGSYAVTRGMCALWNMSDGNMICHIRQSSPIRSVAWVDIEVQRREALAMVLHDRLGAGARLRIVDEEVLRMIAYLMK
jgi:WD40 repeat protein